MHEENLRVLVLQGRSFNTSKSNFLFIYSLFLVSFVKLEWMRRGNCWFVDISHYQLILIASHDIRIVIRLNKVNVCTNEIRIVSKILMMKNFVEMEREWNSTDEWKVNTCCYLQWNRPFFSPSFAKRVYLNSPE